MQPPEHITPEQQELLRMLQQDSFTYFVHKTNRTNGLVLDKSREGWPASIVAAQRSRSVARGARQLQRGVGRPVLCDSAFHQSGDLLCSEDGPAE